MAVADYFESKYEFNGLQYNILDTLEVHQRLTTDSDFFHLYISENVGCLEVAAGTSEMEGETERRWSSRSTKLLLELFNERKNKFRDPKIKKKTLWGQIMQEMHKKGYSSFTEDILDRKFRNLKKTYRSIKDNNQNSSTGRGRITWDYYNIFEEIFCDDRTVNVGPSISSFTAVPSTSTKDNNSTILPVTRMMHSLLSENQMTSPHSIDEMPSSSPSSSNSTPVSSRVFSPEVLFDQEPSTDGPDSVQDSRSSSIQKPQNIGRKRQDSRETYSLKRKLIAVEKERVEAIKKLHESIDENVKVQKERNELFRQYLEKM